MLVSLNINIRLMAGASVKIVVAALVRMWRNYKENGMAKLRWNSEQKP